MIEISDPEDKKILTLARSTRARTRATQGASVRDTDGRTYAAASVDLPSMKLSAVQVAVAMAVSSGSQGLEAVAVLSDEAGIGEDDLSVVRDFAGSGVAVLLATPDGTVRESLTS
ncbi:MAG TPA: cytidine deaminase [Nocardioidaceae bacterium]